MSLSSSAAAVLELLSSSGERLNTAAVKARLPQVPDKTGAIEELLSAGLIWHAGRGRYASLKTLGMEKGKVRIRADGSGVVYSDSHDPLKVQVEAADASGAMDGDTVLVRLLEPDLRRGGYRGRVVQVLERYRSMMAGIARQHSGRWFLDPLDPRLPGNVPIEAADPALQQGDLIGCTIVYGKNSITVRQERSLGTPDSPGALIDTVCLDNGLPEGFPQAVRAAAELSASSPVPNGVRRDLTDLYSITIDPIDARDFDDAISMERTEEGGFRLGVHIADVSAFVPPGSAVDAEAYSRGTSIYLPDRVIPMIPEVLSNEACSLQPDVVRLTKTVLMDYDVRGARKGFSVFSSSIRSRKRLCYEEALEILQGTSSGNRELDEAFAGLAELNRLLNEAREHRGSVDLGSSEFRTVFSDDGTPGGFEPVPDDEAHRMIENFMVEANSAVAEYCGWLELDVLYRVHGDPVPEASDKLRRTLSIYGLGIPGQGPPRASDLSAAVESARGSPVYPLVREAVLRSMQRAVYSPEDTGHYGLALRKYMHFTSPIRRYPDLIVHQAITAYEKGTTVRRHVSMSEAAEACSLLERRADAAERSATELMALLYLSGRKGDVFKGVVRDTADFGIFVRLLDVPVEGLLHVSAMRNARDLLPAVLEPGTPLTVSVENSDPIERKLSLLPAKEKSIDRTRTLP